MDASWGDKAGDFNHHITVVIMQNSALQCIYSISYALFAVVIVLALPTATIAQETGIATRVIDVFEHNGTEFSAYVDEKTGAPVWIVDLDSLDFILGEPQVLPTDPRLSMPHGHF